MYGGLGTVSLVNGDDLDTAVLPDTGVGLNSGSRLVLIAFDDNNINIVVAVVV